MEAQLPPDTAKVSNPIYRKLLKAEAYAVIDAINEVVAASDAHDQAVSQQSSKGPGYHGNYNGGLVKDNYQSGINWRANSVAEAIQRELGDEVNKNGRNDWYTYPELRETTSQNVANIKRVADEIREMADRLQF